MVKIGNVSLGEFPLLLAPMEDVSDPPFRAVCKAGGADLMYVGADGQTIQLTLFGRLEDTYQVKDDGTLHLPFMADTSQITSAVVWDGQTIAAFKKSGDQPFVMFVTPTLIDPAGNRLHAEVEKPPVESKSVQP